MAMYTLSVHQAIKDANKLLETKVNSKFIIDCSIIPDDDETDYDLCMVTMLKEQLQEFWLETFKAPARITLTNVTQLGELTMTRLGIANLDTYIRINGIDIPPRDVPRYCTRSRDLDRSRLPRKLAKFPVTIDDKPTTIGQYFAEYKYGLYDPAIFDAVMQYNQIRINKAKELNQLTDWRPVEDFYVEVTLLSMRNTIEVMVYDQENDEPTMAKVPSIQVKSPSPKTKVESEYQFAFDKEIHDLYADLTAPEEDILKEMRYFDITVPHIVVVCDSKQVTKYHPYQSFSSGYDDVPIGYEDIPKVPVKTGVKYKVFTRVLEEILINPDKNELMKQYFNDTKDVNIPNDIRSDMKPTVIKPIQHMNIAHETYAWLKTLSPEDQEFFRPLDIATCSVCGEDYNIVNGCADLYNDVYHVLPAAIHYTIKPSQMDYIHPRTQGYVKPEAKFCEEYVDAFIDMDIAIDDMLKSEWPEHFRK